MAKGWKGANPAQFMYYLPRCEKCHIPLIETDIWCNKVINYNPLKVFHCLGKKTYLQNQHIIICHSCAKELPNEWHGCGCGG